MIVSQIPSLFASPPCFSATWIRGGAPSYSLIIFLCSSIVCLSPSIVFLCSSAVLLFSSIICLFSPIIFLFSSILFNYDSLLFDRLSQLLDSLTLNYCRGFLGEICYRYPQSNVTELTYLEPIVELQAPLAWSPHCQNNTRGSSKDICVRLILLPIWR